uniref:NADP-dependent oxidoreductase P2 n=1 Tax=Cajanus cajan TaxID=3821 RepID=A0A151RMT3_CAJCA|nr:putative NADP-dependent oxidoreductase P2 [Cajanus cajan]
MGSVVESREWYLASYSPEGVPNSDNLKLRSLSLSLDSHSIPEGHVSLEIVLISVDPYLRTRLTGTLDGLYIAQYEVNEVITAFAVGKVIGSRESKYSEGDVVLVPSAPLAEYCIIPSSTIARKIHAATGISLPHYLSALGVPGFAAWVGIVVLGDPKPGSNVFISAASGAVGTIAGQLAKIRGCRVIGSTGSDQKADYDLGRLFFFGSLGLRPSWHFGVNQLGPIPIHLAYRIPLGQYPTSPSVWVGSVRT